MKPHYTLLPLAPLSAHRALADCSCGYTVNKTTESHHALFTDMIETDFLHTYDLTLDSAQGMGWIPQTYNQSNATGPYGMAKMAANVVANPIREIWDWGGQGMLGGDPGVQLWVRTKKVGESEEAGGVVYVPTSEVVSEREDVLYVGAGSFRMAMKTTSVNGTCAAFFFYRNDTQEIDVEVLSAQRDASSTHFPINLVVQNTTQPLALNGSGPQNSNLEFSASIDPSGDAGDMYHEYRFDWLPNRIDFYVDTYLMWTVTDNVPSTPGAIHFSHWSNGNPGWTYGPPTEDAVMTVAYIKAYFNTTSAPPLSGHDCNSLQWKSASSAYCVIPDQVEPIWPGGPDGNVTGKTFFFTRDDTQVERHGSTNFHPKKGDAVAFIHLRQEALWTLFAVVGIPAAAAFLWRFW